MNYDFLYVVGIALVGLGVFLSRRYKFVTKEKHDDSDLATAFGSIDRDVSSLGGRPD